MLLVEFFRYVGCGCFDFKLSVVVMLVNGCWKLFYLVYILVFSGWIELIKLVKG